MAEFAAMPFWTDAYLADTTHLTTIEHGAYTLLLWAMWRSPDKRLPNNPKLLARYCKLTAGQWKRIGPIIMPFFRVEADSITQGRLTDEATVVRQKSKRQSDKAKARWLKTKESPDAVALPQLCPTDASHNPYPITHNREKDSLSPAATTKRGSRLPADWKPRKEDWESAVACLGLAMATDQLARFCDYWVGVPGARGVKLDWDATWRNWYRKSRDDRPYGGNGNGHSKTTGNLIEAADNLIERLSVFGDRPGTPAVRGGEGEAPIRLLPKGRGQ